MKIAAVVVTYNRKELLLDCLSAIRKQVLDPGVSLDIIVIDNASTDGTEDAIQVLVSNNESVERRVQYYNTGFNMGGAGGFQYGIRTAVELGYDYIWLMDDDCEPSISALSELVDTIQRIPVCDNDQTGKIDCPYGFLSSKVLWKDGSICRMNVQRKTLTKNVTDFGPGRIQSVVMASFVSLFVPVDIIKELGLPIKEFYIWTDDWEWTRRISRRYPCYLVTNSVVTHKSKQNIKADIANETFDRLDRFFYLYRNDVVLYRREGFRGFAYESVRLAGHIVRVLLHAKDHKLIRIQKIVSGTVAGLRFNPEIEYWIDSSQRGDML